MSSRQKQVMLAINAFVLFFLMTFIAQVTRAYVGLDYPEVPANTVSTLITIPNLSALVFAFLIGPIAVKHNKVTLLSTSIIAMIIHCAIYYVNGMMHGPFFLYMVAGACGGYGIGTYIPLINGILSDHFPGDERAKRIANYNVFINIGGVILMQAAGVLAAKNDGAQWYNAYLLGILAVLGLASFLVLAKKAQIQVPSIESASTSGAQAASPRIRDIPRRALYWVVLMGLVHCIFYVTQYAFNTTVSNYIITEYSLGTSVQAGTATSLYRFSLIIFTALYPFFQKTLKEWMIPIGYLCVGVGLIIMMVAKSLFGAYACACFVGLATSLVHASLYGKASRYVPIVMVPVSMSLVNGLVSAGSFASVYILDFCSGLLGGGMSNQFLAGAILSVVIAVAAVFMYVVKKPTYNDDGVVVNK